MGNPRRVDLLETDLHWQQAQTEIQNKDYQAALRALSRAMQEAPPERVAECHALRGWLYLQQDDALRALKELDQAIESGHGAPKVLAWRAQAYGQLERWPEAFDDLSTACERESENPDRYLRLLDSSTERASEHFRKLIAGGRNDADLFFERGWVYYRAGRRDRAERDFRHALDRQSDHALATLGMARLALDTGDSEAAIRFCNSIATQDVTVQRRALLIRAQAKSRLGQVYAVLRDLRRLAKLPRTSIADRLEIAQLRIAVGDPVRAIADLTALLKRHPEETEALRLRAEGYRAIQNYRAAANDFSRYLRRRPFSQSARLGRGQCYLKLGDCPAAQADFDRVLERAPNSAMAMLGRAQVFLAQDQLDQALVACQQAAERDNECVEVFSTSGEIHVRLCEYTRAIEQFERAHRLATTPTQQAHFLYRLGTVLVEQERLPEALTCFRKATRLNPRHSGAWVWKASVCARLDEWAQAIDSLEQAMRARPVAADRYAELGRPVAESAVAHFTRLEQRGKKRSELFRSRGLAHQFLNHVPQAIADYTRALKLDDDFVTRIRLGRCLAELGKHREAVRELTRVVRNEPELHEARYWRARSLRKTDRASHALTDIIKAIRMQRTESRYYLLYAELLVQREKIQPAIRALDRAIRFDPDDPEPYRQRGILFQRLGYAWRAIGDFTRSLELKPEQTDVLVMRGQASLRSGDADQALRDFELAITRAPNQLDAFLGRARALAARGDSQAALIWLTKSIHRFAEPYERAALLYCRGNIFYETGRIERAINDYGCAVKLRRGDPTFRASVRLARARALAHQEEWEQAEGDVRRVLKVYPDSPAANAALKWLTSPGRNGQPPAQFHPPRNVHSPLRPPPVRKPCNVRPSTVLEAQPPLDLLIVRAPDKKEYGPVGPETLLHWASQGRLPVNTQVLRSDWDQWKRIDKIFPELVRREGEVDEFPGIELRSTRTEGPGPAAEGP